MHLLEIEARNWRGLTKTLDDLSPQLNLISGPNESGKSRFYQALRYGLFESHKGSSDHKKHLQTWTEGDSPFVRVAFNHEGTNYEIQKQYLKGSSAVLSGNGVIYKGDEAEEVLRVLMGSKHSGSRRAVDADLGIWPLLMVAQGDSRRALGEQMNTDGRSQLQLQLSREIDVAAISASGHKLMEIAEAEDRRFYTATGRESGQLAEARAEMNASDSSAKVATTAYARQGQTALALADARKIAESLDARYKLLKRNADTAQEKANQAREAESRLVSARGQHEAAKARVNATQQSLQTRQEADAAIARLGQAVSELKETLSARVNEPALTTAADSAEKAVTQAQERFKKAKATLETARREGRRNELTRQHDEARGKVRSLQSIEASLGKARTERAALPEMDVKSLANLRKLEQEAASAAAQLQGAAVSVAITMRSDATVDGIVRRAGERVQIEVIDNRDIEIADVAQVEVRPGRGSLDELRDAAEDARTAFNTSLSKKGFKSLEAASKALIDVQIADQKISELTATAKATSARPLSEFQEELIRLDGELKRLGVPQTIEGSESQLQSMVDEADDSLQSARSAREVANEALKEYQRESATLRARQDDTQRELDHLCTLYAMRETAEQLQAKLAIETADFGLSQQAIEAAQRDFDGFGGLEAQRDAARLSHGVDALHGELVDSRSTVDKLHGNLQTLIGEGGYDVLQQAQARFELAQSAFERIERQARAAAKLWSVLQEERRNLIERLTSPVIARIKPYLASLFPGSTLDTGADLNFDGLRTGNTQEPFCDLSGGAQEQLTLLTRLGIAEVLAGDGTLPILLDDALVNSDSERIQRIHRVLFKAAEKLQVIMFTCHDVLFDALGAHRTIRLSRGLR